MRPFCPVRRWELTLRMKLGKKESESTAPTLASSCLQTAEYNRNRRYYVGYKLFRTAWWPARGKRISGRRGAATGGDGVGPAPHTDRSPPLLSDDHDRLFCAPQPNDLQNSQIGALEIEIKSFPLTLI